MCDTFSSSEQGDDMDNQEPIVVTVAEGMTDCDEVWAERNRLALALRQVVALHGGSMAIWEMNDGSLVGATWGDVAMNALVEVFPEDPLGEQAIYDCPDARGVNRLREEADRGTD